MPFFRTVFAYSPVPQVINDPKSLYQSPSGPGLGRYPPTQPLQVIEGDRSLG